MENVNYEGPAGTFSDMGPDVINSMYVGVSGDILVTHPMSTSRMLKVVGTLDLLSDGTVRLTQWSSYKGGK